MGLSGGFGSWWASLTSVDGERFVDTLRNRIGEVMGREYYSCLALRHQLLSPIPLPLPVNESVSADSFAGPG